MTKCNEVYKQYQQTRKDQPNDNLRVDIELKQYQEARNLSNRDICKEHVNKCDDKLRRNYIKKHWNEINCTTEKHDLRRNNGRIYTACEELIGLDD